MTTLGLVITNRSRALSPMPSQKLTPQRAIDTDGDTVPISGKISPELKEWLRTQPGGFSFHVRQALKIYQKLLNNEVTLWESKD